MYVDLDKLKAFSTGSRQQIFVPVDKHECMALFRRFRASNTAAFDPSVVIRNLLVGITREIV